MKKILVIHQGARDSYKVTEAFFQHGYDVHLLTSGYASKGVRSLIRFIPLNGMKKLGRRYIVGMNDKNVFGLLFVELIAKLLERLIGEAFALEWINKKIANKAVELQKKYNYDVVFSYNYNAFIPFSDLIFRDVQKILFQCHPHPIYIRKKFSDFEKLGFFTSTNSEKEFTYSFGYQAMLIAEPFIADKIICASSITKNSLTYCGIPTEKIKVIPYGASLNKDYKDDHNTSDDIKIIFVGQFVQRKGLAVVAEIMKKLDSKFSWIFVGRGGTDYDMDIIKSISSKVQVFWDVSPNMLTKLYSDADIFLFPSLMEGFGLVVLEAMSFGVVPVVSNLTAGLDVVKSGESGFVIDPSDINEYVRILNLLSDPIKRKLIANNALLASKDYSWETFMAKIINEVA